MLFVDDDDADICERCEDGQARPDDDVDVTRPDPSPFIRALAFAEA